MRKLSLLPLILIGTMGSALADDLRLGEPAYGGSGCPAGSASASLSPDRTALTVLFDRYQVEAGRAVGKTLDRKNCDLAVPVQVPAGFQVSVLRLDYRGFSALPVGGSGEFDAEYFFPGNVEVPSRQIFASGVTGDYIVTNNLAAISWSDCGAQVILRANTSVRVATNGNGEQALASVDSADIKAGVVFHLNMRSCGFNPQPQPQPFPPMPQPQPQPFPPMPQPLPPIGGSLVAEGNVEGVQFRLAGNSGQDIMNQCMDFINRSRISQIDDIYVNGQTRHNGPSYWSVGEACQIITSVATQTSGPIPQPQPFPQPQPQPQPFPQPGVFVANVQVETNRYRMSGNSYGDMLNQCLETLTRDPSLNRSNIDDVTVNGVYRHNGPSYWNLNEICQIVASISTQQGQPQPQPQPQPFPGPVPGGSVADVTIENSQFRLVGRSYEDFQGQCLDMFRRDPSLPRSNIDDISVNGISRHNGPSYWNQNEVCQIVATLATQNR